MPVHSLPEMSKPPVAEVVCGVFFAPLGGLDGLSLGAYWAERRVDFPERRLLAAVFDSAEPMIEWGMGTPPLRSWMISGSEEYIVQLQQDRFYLNWRAGKSQRYPRFQNTPNGRGIASLLTEEFARFGAFCDSTLQERPTLLLADLSKINTLTQGVHWNSFDDLKAVLPIFNGMDAAIGGVDASSWLQRAPSSNRQAIRRHRSVSLQAWPDILVRLTRARIVSTALIRGRACARVTESTPKTIHRPLPGCEACLEFLQSESSFARNRWSVAASQQPRELSV